VKSQIRNLVVGTLLLGATAFAAPTMVVAQDDDEFGAFLYAASCDDLNADAIIEDVGDLDIEDDADDAAKEWLLLGSGQDAPDKLYAEDEGVPAVTLDDLVSQPHAVAIHASDSPDADVIACGDVTGTPENDSLMVGLPEVSGSGIEGRAHFAPNNRNEIEVTIGAFSTGQVDALASPEASPGA
jgi:hypothetical protein